MSERYKISIILFFIAAMSATLWSCSADKFIPDNEYLLDKVEVRSDTTNFDAAQLAQFVRQKGNSRWFSLFKIPLGTYAMAGRDTTKWINRTLRNIGEKPVIFDTLKARQSCTDLREAMRNMGYMNARVDLATRVKGKKLKAIYTLHPGDPFTIRRFSYDIGDTAIARVLNGHLSTPLSDNASQRPRQFTVAALDGERKRIAEILNDSGYYRFHKDFIYYTADSLRGTHDIDVTLHLMPYTANDNDSPHPHPRYKIRSVTFLPGDSTGMHIRHSVLDDNTLLEPGRYFSYSDLQRTYNNFARLGAIRYTDINFAEPGDSDALGNRLLDASLRISTNKPNTISFQPEGTNTAGDLGAAASLTYQNRNLFRGSELFSLELRAAFEAITGLEGYEDHDYEEYGVEARLQFPRFLAPFISREFRRRSNATSEVSVSWDLQNRPEFHRRVFSAGWKYRWSNPRRHLNYEYDLLDLNYVYMPWISPTFKHDYIDSVSNRNAILRYNYEDLFIMKMGFGVTWHGGGQAIRANIETAGNLLGAASGLFRFDRNKEGQKTLFNIAYAQYVKFDFDYTKLFVFDTRNQLALHGRFGIAWPYGNSDVLPFEKRYFAGGPNSVRGWSVRELGPGKFRGTDGRIDFINQTGDLKLDLNAEYRTHLFWKLDGAAFIDAGNIWTLRDYPDQPGGQFKLSEFYKQIAVAYGLGIRLNFDYFILRFDAAMKAINPAYESNDEHYAIFHPDLGRDFTFHFAVGLPF